MTAPARSVTPRRIRYSILLCPPLGLVTENGALLWDYAFPVKDGNTIAQPVLLSTTRFLLSAGYGAGCTCVEIQRTATGFAAQTLWRNKNLKNKFTSSVMQDGFIYGLDEDMLACLDAATGQRKWKDGRYGYGQLLLASQHLIILCGTGDLALVKATPDRYQELARVPGIHARRGIIQRLPKGDCSFATPPKWRALISGRSEQSLAVAAYGTRGGVFRRRGGASAGRFRSSSLCRSTARRFIIARP
jgi:hypothetical protein